MNQAEPVLNGNWSKLNLGGQVAWFVKQLQNSDPQQAMANIGRAQAQQAQSLQILAAALSQSDAYKSPLPEVSSLMSMQRELEGGGYSLINGDRVGLVTLWLAKDHEDAGMVQFGSSIQRLRQIIADVQSRHPEAWIGLTGLPIMENDEMESSQWAMTWAGILSFIGVGLLYIAGFGCVRHPMMALVALFVPMAWSCGYIILSVGHLNILSSAFATIVIGLGSDYGVYHIGQYLRYRRENLSTRDALHATARTVGPGLTTSALATALAFYTIGLSDFPGIAELGIIAGGGLLLCWIASLTTLPAMLFASDDKRPPWKAPAPLDIYGWLSFVVKLPGMTVLAYLGVTLLICTGLPKLRYDNNLLNLQAEGLESVELEKQLLQKSDQSTSFAVTMAKTPEELVELEKRFGDRTKCSMVDTVRDINTFLPTDTASKQPIIRRIHDRLTNLPKEVPQITVDAPETLDLALAQLQQFMTRAQRTEDAQALEQIRKLVTSLPKEEYYRRLSAFQQSMAADLLGRLYSLQGVSNPDPPQYADLPAGLVSRFVGKHKCLSLQIYTKADIWDMDAMEHFIREVRSVDPNVTGNPIQVYESSRQMKWGYEKGAIYGIIIVLAVVYLDFRNIRMALLALLPLLTSKLQLFGLMGLLDIPLNPANMIVLPLILGIGVDTGVQIVHDYLREPYPYRMNASTAAALVINTLMNIVGFGGLMIASHRGLHSLGRVLTLGMACCLVSCVIMPAFLRWMPNMKPQRYREPEVPDDEEPPPDIDLGLDLSSRSNEPRLAPPIRRRSTV
jgi:hopanoid biosynthesis associated RND transporter like protein HpnN